MNCNIALVLSGFWESSADEVDEIVLRLNTEEIFILDDRVNKNSALAGGKGQCVTNLRELAESIQSPWVCFWDGVALQSHADFGWGDFGFEDIPPENVDLAIFFHANGRNQSVSTVNARQLEFLPSNVGTWAIRTEAFRKFVDQIGGKALCGIPSLAVLRRYLLENESSVVAIQGQPAWSLSVEPHFEYWRNLDSYGRLLTETCLEPLTLAKSLFGRSPLWLQRAVVEQLHWYFDVDLRERAPTVIINSSRAKEFHDRIGKILALIDEQTIWELQSLGVKRNVIHALLSYTVQPMHDVVYLDAYDAAQGLARVRYFIQGEKRPDIFRVEGQNVEPVYAKYRACNFFARTLYWQRIVWLALLPGMRLECSIGGCPVPVTLEDDVRVTSGQTRQESDHESQDIEKLHRPTKGGKQPIPFNRRGVKARILRAMSGMPWIRARSCDAWVFVDRDEYADDSAEHVYRWVSTHHPEINCWFLLNPDSPDWARLEKEGFRLVAPGLERKLLLLNAKFIISSHAQYMNGGFDPVLYGDLMRWRYVFLQHGVIKDDLSHWLSELGFDIFVTSSPAEHESIIADDTAYQYTDREVYRTGLPRHDRLLRLAAEVAPKDVDVILVMPTWRGGLVDRRAGKFVDPIHAFAQSEYAQVWGSFLRSPEVHALCSRYGKRLVFMPHANVASYVAAFDLPEYVQIATSTNTSIQQLFSRSVALITDYTSVAFTFALLRRTVFYYQYDRDDFFGGGHNWREGYFDFERDGFGPVVYDEKTLVSTLGHFLENDCMPERKYLVRMTEAMPETDGKSCERLYEVISSIDSQKSSGMSRNRVI